MTKKSTRTAARKGRTASRKSASRKVRKPARSPRAATAGKTRKQQAAARKPRVAGESLGRPLVTAEEKLYLLFKEDYHARQIFEYLRVGTVGELEQFSPQQIIQILSTPVRQTVVRIRERLAEHKRYLRDDSPFAREYLVAKRAD